jgi:type I restriction enzyme S subunit
VDDNDPIILWDGSNAGEVFFAKKGILASTMARLLPRSEEVSKTYLGHSLKRHEGYLKAMTAGSGIPHVDKAIVKRLPFFKPAVGEQNAISDTLSVLDAAISAARESIAKAERLQKALMQQLLTGRMRPDGSMRRKGEFWTHPKLGLVPKGWEVSPLKLLAEIQRGKFSHRPRNDPRFFGGSYPFIQTADIVSSQGYIRTHSQTLNDEGKKISRSFSAGTIMITIAANIGDTAIVTYEVFATDSVIGITPTSTNCPEFLEFNLRLRKTYLRQMATESAQANINYGNLRPLLIAHPIGLESQAEIVAPITRCESLIAAKQTKITALQRLKKALMQNLLTGRIRLPVEGAEEGSRPGARRARRVKA